MHRAGQNPPLPRPERVNREETVLEDISDTKGEEIFAASSTTLPSAELQGLRDSLIY
jgi:hypothetical protein